MRTADKGGPPDEGAPNPQAFRLGAHLIRPDLNRILGPDRLARVEPKAMAVLVALSSHPGQVLSRDHVIREVWGPAGATDDLLSRCISELRKALDDDPRAPRFIETIRKGGYRLMVEPIPLSGAVQSSLDLVVPVVPVVPFAPVRSRRLWLGVAATVVLAAALGTWPGGNAPQVVAPESGAPGAFTTAPLVSLSGVETHPRFSPDGERVVFAWRAADGTQFDLYLAREGRDPERLTFTEDASEVSPDWSPDGTRVAFVRHTREGCSVAIRDTAADRESIVHLCAGARFGRLRWAADGGSLLMVGSSVEGGPSRVYRLPLPERGLSEASIGQPIAITAPPLGTMGDDLIALSDDGAFAAISRVTVEGVADVYRVALETGEIERVTFDEKSIYGLDLASDGSVLFSSNRSGGFGIWRLAPGAREPEFVATSTAEPHDMHLSRAEDRLVYSHATAEVNVWRTPLADGQAAPTLLLASARADSKPRLSPDGSLIAFESNRSGTYEIWVASSDGQSSRRITDLGGPYNGSARWSPDGTRLAFDGRPDGYADIYVADLESGAVTRVSDHQAQDAVPSWSQDGRSLYFASNRGGTWQVWKTELATGDVEQVTHRGGYTTQEDPQGRYLYFARGSGAGLWRLPLGQGGPEELVVPELGDGDFDAWALTTRGIVYLERGRPDHLVLADPESGARTELVEAPGVRVYSGGVDADAQGSFALVPRLDRVESHIMIARWTTGLATPERPQSE